MKYNMNIMESEIRKRVRRMPLRVLCLLLVCFCSTVIRAQERKVHGTVFDETGQPAIGATVVVKGTQSMTITDLDGKFLLSVPAGAKMMEVSYVGYETSVVALSGKDEYVINLKVADLALDEVVVSGYGTAKKGNVTSAIASLQGEELENRPNESVLSSLQGQQAGGEISTNFIPSYLTSALIRE